MILKRALRSGSAMQLGNMHAAVDHSAWKHGKRVETGGIVLGEKDEVLKIIW